MERCKTCKHWRPVTRVNNCDIERAGACNAVSTLTGFVQGQLMGIETNCSGAGYHSVKAELIREIAIIVPIATN